MNLIAHLKIILADQQVAALQFSKRPIKHISNDPLYRDVLSQLNSYFSDPQFQFDLPLQLNVTSFQKKVLAALRRIPVGTTRSYGDLAKQLNTSARAIGNACRANPVPIIIPCHRIVGQSSLGGYAGATAGQKMAIKIWLLQHETCEY